MKNMFAKSVVRSLVAATVLAFVAQVALAQAPPERGKIYMLTVWTGTSRNSTTTAKPANSDHTQNKDFSDAVKASREAFERNLSLMELDPEANKDVVAKYVTLSNEETSPQKIVDTIYELAQEAGEDDALFVYIMSHGASIDPELCYGEKRDADLKPGFDREHFIMPLIETKEADCKNDAIMRSNLLYYMRSKKHRLDVLITDSCSGVVKPNLDRAKIVPEQKTILTAVALRYLLTHEYGTISWNSSCPCFCYSVRETSDFFDEGGQYRSPKLTDLILVGPGGKTEPSKTSEKSYLDKNEGSLFTRAFIVAATRRISNPENGYTFEDFFQDLGADYDEGYRTYLARVAFSDYASFEDVASTQALTTLTAFNVDDERTGDWTKIQEIVSKKNNRVKNVYDHNGIGSGKTDTTIKMSWVSVSEDQKNDGSVSFD